jgi:hypothetical protein
MPAVVLDDGSVVVPARTAAILLAELGKLPRDGRRLPEIETVLSALGVGARMHRGRQARLQDLERRAAGAIASQVLATALVEPPLESEVTVAVAAARLGVTDGRVRQLASAGRLAGRKAAGAWYFPADAVNELAKERANVR